MAHYFTEDQDSDLNIKDISCVLRGNKMSLRVGSGVFSKSRIDPGSKVLIEHCIMQDGWRILDLGCGYGAVGISLAKAFPGIEVQMTDINKRGVMLARMNTKHNKLDKSRVKVFQGDSFKPIKADFDTILLNPPQTAGKDLCLRMIEDSKNYLKDKGLLQVVARHNKGGRSLEAFMKEVFGNSRSIYKEKGYRIYVSKKDTAS